MSTDEDLYDDIQVKVGQLNDLLSQAADQNLVVDLTVHEGQLLSFPMRPEATRRMPTTVTVRMLREIKGSPSRE